MTNRGSTGSQAPASRPAGAGGRPVDATVEQRVLREARAELASVGVESFSLTATLRRAKVGNSGFYRRWSGAQELILDALSSVATWPDVPDLGDLRQELTFLVETFDRPATWNSLQILFAFAGQAAKHPELFAHYQRAIMLPSNERVIAVFERSCARGDFAPSSDPKALAAAFVGALTVVKHWSVDTSGKLDVDFRMVVDTFVGLSTRGDGS